MNVEDYLTPHTMVNVLKLKQSSFYDYYKIKTKHKIDKKMYDHISKMIDQKLWTLLTEHDKPIPIGRGTTVVNLAYKLDKDKTLRYKLYLSKWGINLYGIAPRHRKRTYKLWNLRQYADTMRRRQLVDGDIPTAAKMKTL